MRTAAPFPTLGQRALTWMSARADEDASLPGRALGIRRADRASSRRRQANAPVTQAALDTSLAGRTTVAGQRPNDTDLICTGPSEMPGRRIRIECRQVIGVGRGWRMA